MRRPYASPAYQHPPSFPLPNPSDAAALPPVQARIFLHHSSVPFKPASAPVPAFPTPSLGAPVSVDEVIDVQTRWAAAIKRISAIHAKGGDYVAAAGQAAGELYGYGHGDVMFKPTRCSTKQFRPTAADAMSYFVGYKSVATGYEEDMGFAINGGKGWANCVYDNHQVQQIGGAAIAMGNYYFTCATTGDKVKVEYVFGYKRCEDDKVRIFLHHSSVPFKA